MCATATPSRALCRRPQQLLRPRAYSVRYRARGRRRRGGGAARAQWRGKIDDVPLHCSLVENRSGRILFEGKDLSKEPTHAIVRGGLGYVPEERRIFTDLTVEENLESAVSRSAPTRRTGRAKNCSRCFPTSAMRSRPGGRMSGGEQQMLTIARTLIGNPSLVLLDEPSEGLSPKIVSKWSTPSRHEEGERFHRRIRPKPHSRVDLRSRLHHRARPHLFGGTMAELDARPDIRDAHLSL